MASNELAFKLTVDGKEMEVGLQNAGRLLRLFEQNLQQTSKSVKRLEESQFSLGTKFRNLVLTLGNLRFALLDIYDVFLRLPGSILQTAGELERMQQLMEGLSLQASDVARKIEAATSFDFLIDTARNAPFQIEALSESFVKLKAVGIDPTAGSMQALVDSVARFGGTSENLKRASVAIQQMVGKGVVSMEELRQQLGEAVPDAMEAMAVGMGMSMAELTKAVSKGTVEATDAITRMLTVLNLRNRGAAKEMVDTWVGALSQLQTEWQLSAKQISEAGFAEEAVKVVKAVVEGLQSREFARFASDFGKFLGDMTAGAAELGRNLIEAFAPVGDALITLANLGLDFVVFLSEWEKTIQLLIAGFVALKVAMGIQSVLKGLEKNFESFSKVIRTTQYALEDYAERERFNKIAAIEMERDRTAAAIQASRDIIAARQAESAALIAANAELYKQYTRLSQARPRDERGTFMSKAAAAQQLAQVTAEINANNRALIQNSLEVDRNQRAVQAHNAALVGQVAQLNAAQAATTRLTAAQQVGYTVGRALGGLWSLMGGWLGVLNIALVAGIAIWGNYAMAVQEADNRLRRLRQGVNDRKDQVDFENELAEAEAKVVQLQANVETTKNAIKNASNAGEQSVLRATLAKAEADLRAAEQARAEAAARVQQGRENVIRQEAEDTRDAYRKQTEVVLEAITDRYDQEGDIIRERFRELKNQAEGNQKRLAELADAENRALAGLGVRDANERLAALQGNLDVLQRRRDLNAKEQKLLQDLVQDQIRAAKRDRDNAESLLRAPNILTSPDDKKPKKGQGAEESPLEKYIIKLKEDRAALQVEIEGLTGANGQIDIIERELKAFEARLAAGRYEKNPDPKLVDEARKLTETTATLESVKDRAADVAREAEKVAPQLATAMAIIADPLGPSKDKAFASSNKLLEDLNKLEQRLQALGDPALAAKALETITQLKASLGNSSGTIAVTEAATLYQEIVRENQRFGDELVKTDLERINRQFTAEKALSDARKKLLMDYLDVAVQSGKLQQAEAEKIIAALAENDRLRMDRWAENAKTPFQKMVDEWSNSTAAMEQASLRWLQQTEDALVNFVMTGKLEWRSLAESIISDIIRIQLRAQMAQLFASSGASTGTGFLSSIGSAIAGFFGFANGGIMTGAGPLALRKYAAGGIANSPQLALFGEGSMPEAYVPLPDGRTIPVTMKSEGQGGPGYAGGVVVNVINQTGQPVNASQNGPRFDGKQMILDVVLSAAASPGPFRDGMRSMMGAR